MKDIEKILKTTNVIKASPNDTLSSTLSKLASSHDAAFVFNDSNEFVGIINPYYTSIKSSANEGSTKISHVLFHPPRITRADSLDRIVTLMNESKVHYLPVFEDDGSFMGITSARRILMYMRTMEIANTTLLNAKHTQKGRVITVQMDDSISKAMALFKEFKTSKIVVVDQAGKLKGIMSHYDLIPLLMAPSKSSRKGSRGEHSTVMEKKVKNYAKTMVLTLKTSNTLKEAIDLILDRGIGSIIITNEHQLPMGIVTTKDILSMITKPSTSKLVNISSNQTSHPVKLIVSDLEKFVSEHIQSLPNIRSAEVSYEEEKNERMYRIRVHIIPTKGKGIVITREGKDITKVVHDVKNAVRNQ
ncbi:MAG: CBS domain-containing protein [bacterium]|nr:CBS domain-containing protein [bacterium]